jgi:uncharacterized protein (TIGR03067 family)
MGHKFGSTNRHCTHYRWQIPPGAVYHGRTLRPSLEGVVAMRRTVCLLAVLLVLPSLGSDSPKEYDGATEGDGIEGKWQCIAYQKQDPFQSVLIVRAGTYTISYKDGDVIEGNIRIDPNQNPAHLDENPLTGYLKGETLKCIYQIEGDTLRIAGLPGLYVQRPKGFNDPGIEVSTYKRVRK